MKNKNKIKQFLNGRIEVKELLNENLGIDRRFVSGPPDSVIEQSIASEQQIVFMPVFIPGRGELKAIGDELFSSKEMALQRIEESKFSGQSFAGVFSMFGMLRNGIWKMRHLGHTAIIELS